MQQFNSGTEMKGSQKVSINWDDHNNNFRESLQELKDNENFLDVTLVCDDDTQIKAHKNVLSVGSNFFRNILRKNPHPEPLLYLKGLRHSELLPIVEFIYLGEVEIAQDNLDKFLSAAKDLKIKGLIEMKDSVVQCVPMKTDNEENEDKNKSSLKDDDLDSYPLNLEDCSKLYKVEKSNGVQEDLVVFSDTDREEKGYLIDRIESFIEKEDILWKCKECGKVAKKRSSIRSHAETHIKGMPLVNCGICGKSYKSMTVLNAHRRQYHKRNADMSL